MVLSIITIVCLVRAYSDYKLNRTISGLHRAQDEANKAIIDLNKIIHDSSREVIEERKEKRRNNYVSRLLTKNKHEVVIHLDSIQLNYIPDTIYSLSTIRKLKVIPSSEEDSIKNENVRFELSYISSNLLSMKNIEEIDISENRVSYLIKPNEIGKNLKSFKCRGHSLSIEELNNLKNILPLQCKFEY